MFAFTSLCYYTRVISEICLLRVHQSGHAMMDNIMNRERRRNGRVQCFREGIETADEKVIFTYSLETQQRLLRFQLSNKRK